MNFAYKFCWSKFLMCSAPFSQLWCVCGAYQNTCVSVNYVRTLCVWHGTHEQICILTLRSVWLGQRVALCRCWEKQGLFVYYCILLFFSRHPIMIVTSTMNQHRWLWCIEWECRPANGWLEGSFLFHPRCSVSPSIGDETNDEQCWLLTSECEIWNPFRLNGKYHG